VSEPAINQSAQRNSVYGISKRVNVNYTRWVKMVDLCAVAGSRYNDYRNGYTVRSYINIVAFV